MKVSNDHRLDAPHEDAIPRKTRGERDEGDIPSSSSREREGREGTGRACGEMEGCVIGDVMCLEVCEGRGGEGMARGRRRSEQCGRG